MDGGSNSLYITANPTEEQPRIRRWRPRATEVAATIIDGMRPRTIGRALGIGVRVAGRIAGQRLAASALPAAASPQVRNANPIAGSGAQAQTVSQGLARATMQAGQPLNHTGKSVSRGVGGLLHPFRRVGGILWLEVTGVFFLLFALVFTRGVVNGIANYAHTSDHGSLWGSTGAIVVFLYLGISSFWRANRR